MLRYNFNNASGLAARQFGSFGLARYFYGKTELRNFDTDEDGTYYKAGIPNGVSHPTAWRIPTTSGGIASYNNLEVSITGGLQLPTVLQANGSTNIAFSASAAITGVGVISGDITPFTALSPQSLADAVWNAEANNYLTTGSTGKFLNSTKSNADLIPAAL